MSIGVHLELLHCLRDALYVTYVLPVASDLCFAGNVDSFPFRQISGALYVHFLAKVKVQVSLRLYFGVMTMWLVELMLVAKVYLRTLVPRCPLMEVCDPPVQKDQRRGYRRLEGFSFLFDLSRR